MLDVVLAVEVEQPDADTSGRTRFDKQVPRDFRIGVEPHFEQTVSAGVTRRDNFADQDDLARLGQDAVGVVRVNDDKIWDNQ